MAKIKHFVVNDFGVNAYIVYDETGGAVIIDGAANSDKELNELLNFINEKGLRPKYIINTHGHLDHICGNVHLKSHFEIPILMNNEDDFLVENSSAQAAAYCFPMKIQPKADETINDDQIISFGDSQLKAIHVPGHSPGSIAFYDSDAGFVITGDALFQGSIGRTDLPRGNHKQLLESISNKLFTLPSDTLVLPGHGPETRIRDEKKFNPFFS